jgi:hypothetical protein
MAKFFIGVLFGIAITMLFFENFPGGIQEAVGSAKRAIQAYTP